MPKDTDIQVRTTKLNFNKIRKSIEKIEKAKQAFPDIFVEYENLKIEERNKRLNALELANLDKLKCKAEKIGMASYIQFINFSFEQYPLISEEVITLDLLKEKLKDNCIDASVKELISKKTKKGLLSLLNNEFTKLNGNYYGRRRRGGSRFSDNFSRSLGLIYNYIVQNDIDIIINNESSFYNHIPSQYKYELHDFDTSVIKEEEISNEIIKLIEEKVNSVNIDFRKTNFKFVFSSLEKLLKSKINSVKIGEEIKCVEEMPGLTLLKKYKVVNSDFGSGGNLLVSVLNDNIMVKQYNYRVFDSMSLYRDNILDEILN